MARSTGADVEISKPKRGPDRLLERLEHRLDGGPILDDGIRAPELAPEQSDVRLARLRQRVELDRHGDLRQRRTGVVG
jgi:hypothetical protein